MKILFYDTHKYDRTYFDKLKKDYAEITYVKEDLTTETVDKTNSKEYEAICTFVNSDVSKGIIDTLANNGIKFIFQRSAGFNNIDIEHAKSKGIKVYRVPGYSPESIAEFAMANIYALARKLVISNKKISKYNFSIEGHTGIRVAGKIVGVIGAGLIGQLFIKLAKGNGLTPIVYDDYLKEHKPEVAKKLGFKFVTLEELCKQSDFISLHAPLLPSTKYIINAKNLKLMKQTTIIINTARGPLINTKELLDALDANIIDAAALDVYENEGSYFFYDWSNKEIEDKLLVRLINHPKILLTSHQAFFTYEALKQIATVTYQNIESAINNSDTNIVN